MSLNLNRFSISDLNQSSAFFREHGFVIFNDIFEQSVMQNFEKDYKELVQIGLKKAKSNKVLDVDSETFISEGIKELERIDHKYVADIYDTSCMMPSFLQIVSNYETINAAKNLLETKSVLYPYTNRIRIDPPADSRRTYGWHQETFYTIPRSKFIQTWAPLIFDVREINGTISIADGSHSEGIPSQTWSEVPGGATQILIPDEIINKYPEIKIEMNVGELLFFSGRLGHKSGDNLGTSVRFSLVGMYHEVEKEEFSAPAITFAYKGQTPKEYFDEEMK
jgi:ectoine hydroxylase-related dioxygenase (phytanoyl-CoA dioxygenase family)